MNSLFLILRGKLVNLLLHILLSCCCVYWFLSIVTLQILEIEKKYNRATEKHFA